METRVAPIPSILQNVDSIYATHSLLERHGSEFQFEQTSDQQISTEVK